MAERKLKMDSVLAIFKKFDKNGDGMMEEGELGRVLCELNPKDFNEERIQDMFYVMDANYDGQVSIEEFVGWIWGNGGSREAQRQLSEMFGGEEVDDAMDVSTEVEAITAELDRDVCLLERLVSDFNEDPQARDALRVEVPKPPPLDYDDWLRDNGRRREPDAEVDYKGFRESYLKGGQVIQIAFAEHKGGWEGLDERLRKPAVELLRFLKDGGEVPAALTRIILSRRNLVGNWKNRLGRLQGGYLMTGGKGGRNIEAVYQFLDKKDGRHIWVRPLASQAHASPAIKALAESDGQGGWFMAITKAVPLLDMAAPAPLAARAAELSHELDDIIQVLMWQRPSHWKTLDLDQFQAAARLALRPPETTGKTSTIDIIEEDGTLAEEDPRFEIEVASLELEEEVAHVRALLANRPKDENAARVATCCAKAEDLLQFLRKGGPVPPALQPTLLNRRNLTGNWKRRAERLRGGFFLTEGKGGRSREVVYQLLGVKDPRTVIVRRLCAASAEVTRLAQGEDSEGLHVNIRAAVPVLDLINPAPLAARAAEVAAELHDAASTMVNA